MDRILRTAVGVVVGYVLAAGLIVLVQVAWVGRLSWGSLPLGTLALSGLLTCVSAAVGGVVATVIALPRARMAAAIMASLVTLQTMALLLAGQLQGPLWFELLVGVALVFSILAGAEAYLRLTGPASSTE